MELAISLKGVCKSFGSTFAVRDLDLALPAGAVYGFIGPNGAGKTTSLRMIMSILLADRGEISVLGRPSALEARDWIGYLPEERGVYRKMRVGAFLTYMARLKAVKEAEIASRVRSWLERVELGTVIDKRCEDLSKGMLQKVQLVAAVLHEPRLLILDEPFSGLDPVNARLLRDVVLEIHRRGSTILFSTHIMVQAEELCDHIVMLDRGVKVLDEPLSSIRARYTARAIRLEPLDAAADLAPLLALPEVSGIGRDGRGYRVDLDEGVDPVRAMRALAGSIPLSGIELLQTHARGHLRATGNQESRCHAGAGVRRIFHVARRDFIATVTTRAFIVALILPPVFYAAFGWFAPRMLNERVPATSGELSVVDREGAVIGGVRDYLRPEAILGRRRAAIDRAAQSLARSPAVTPAAGAARAADLMGDSLNLDVVEIAEAHVSQAKAALAGGDKRRIALVVIHPDAVRKSAEGTYGTYDLFVRANLDDRIQAQIRDALEDSIVHARLHAAGLNPDDVEAMTTVRRVRSVTVTNEGEADTVPLFTHVLPFAFAILLLMSVMSSGQYLMTTTIEEKASRTMEVILSAVSPLELMTGKILGQLAVGLMVLSIYSSVGVAVLFSLTLLGLLDLSLLFYLFIFFLLTYLVFGSLMAAVGAAVNELREAQSLLMPITLLMMVPWLFLFKISRDPASLFSTVISFVPPMNAMAMLARMTSTSPPPLWQVWLSIGVSVAAACATLWFAAKIFRIGLLMHGRPPNFRTLVEWASRA